MTGIVLLTRDLLPEIYVKKEAVFPVIWFKPPQIPKCQKHRCPTQTPEKEYHSMCVSVWQESDRKQIRAIQ